MVNATPLIYFDYNATAPLGKGVKEAVCSALDQTGNPSSIHRSGKIAKSILTKARQILGDHLGISPQDLIFTSGGTEANAMALYGVDVEVLFVSSIEHASVFQTAQRRPNTLFQEIPVNSQGIIDLEALTSLLESVKGKKILISVMMANNESGVVQPLSEIQERACSYSALMHVDAVQAL
ncbi:MAG: hypothetical protein B7Y79_00235, partial [Rhodospirillales bacterium 35-44-4]